MSLSPRSKPPFLVKARHARCRSLDILGWCPAGTLERSVAWIIEAYNQKNQARNCLLFWDIVSLPGRARGFRPIDLVDVLHRPLDDDILVGRLDLVLRPRGLDGFGYLQLYVRPSS